ncbi:MAG: hypothetical protein M3R38_25315 [Actinomycetota bacterium]|nr:hypothetical protein [Actinomycetota bacterium]
MRFDPTEAERMAGNAGALLDEVGGPGEVLGAMEAETSRGLYGRGAVM